MHRTHRNIYIPRYTRSLPCVLYRPTAAGSAPLYFSFSCIRARCIFATRIYDLGSPSPGQVLFFIDSFERARALGRARQHPRVPASDFQLGLRVREKDRNTGRDRRRGRKRKSRKERQNEKEQEEEEEKEESEQRERAVRSRIGGDLIEIV